MIYKFKNVCNGVYIDGAYPSPEAKQALYLVYLETLGKFENLIEGRHLRNGLVVGTIDTIDGAWRDVCLGSRTNFSGVLGRLQGIPSGELIADPEGWIMDALRDCASADYYYAFEKDYN